jgi:hypothetical protein
VPEWRPDAFSTAPLITADGRNVYLLSEDGQNFADLPTRYGDSAIVAFARNPLSGRLTRLPGPRGCLGAARVRSCRRLAARFIAEDVVEAAGGRAVALATFAPTRGQNTGLTLRLLERHPALKGRLSPVPHRRGCASPAPQRACQRIRGLKPRAPESAAPLELQTSPDGRYLYALREGVAVFRVDR